MMANLQIHPLSTLTPLSTHFKICIKVDKIFNREYVWIIGPRRSAMKELISIDVTICDQEGTKMVMRIMSEDARDIFMERIKERASYEILNPIVESGGEGVDNEYHLVLHASCSLKQASYEILNPIVESGGEGVDNEYHLVLHASCSLKQVDASFPEFSNIIKIPSQLWRGNIYPNGYFDIVGFLVRVGSVEKTKSNSIWEKQVEILLGTWDPMCGWIRRNVLCILRGNWIEGVVKILENEIDIDDPTFVHVRYVVLEDHLPSGSPVVSSFSDATTVEIDPDTQEVLNIKERMFDMSIDF